MLDFAFCDRLCVLTARSKAVSAMSTLQMFHLVVDLLNELFKNSIGKRTMNFLTDKHVIVFCFIYAQCYSDINVSPPPSFAVVRDIKSAFLAVSSNLHSLNKLIPQMLNLSVVNPIYVFEMPDENRLWRMHRSDLVQPTFPNLTSTHFKFMKDRENMNKINKDNEIKVQERQNASGHLVLKSTIENEAENKSHPPQIEQSTDWELLGLHGWKGEISNPVPSITLNQQTKPTDTKSENSDFSIEKLKDASPEKCLENLNQRLKNVAPEHNNQSTFEETLNMYSDSDIYIARVNDPFGQSTKWELRNTSTSIREDRSKRAVIELYSMIKCSTQCDPIIYKGYGCYCGFLGAGVPVNGIDRCCRLHDKCYEKSNCQSYLEYFVPYIWKCYRGRPLCAIEHGEWGGPHSCAARLCHCDLHLSRCLRRFSCPQRRAVCATSAARKLQNLLFIR